MRFLVPLHPMASKWPSKYVGMLDLLSYASIICKFDLHVHVLTIFHYISLPFQLEYFKR